VETDTQMFAQLGIALLLGLLVGLQREHAAVRMIGMRTFPLISVLGTVSAILGQAFGGLVVAAGLLGVAGLLTWSHWVRAHESHHDVGATTDMAALLMFGVGALLVVAPLAVGIAIGGGVAVLLQFKPELHGLAQKLGDEDLKAIMQFVLITCIILPVLPDQTFGPPGLEVFNPRETWLLVVLIVGINLGGYIAYKFLGPGAGILLGGILGGAISSTATTVSYSRQARGEGRTDLESVPHVGQETGEALTPPSPNGRADGAARVAAVVIMIASLVMFVRIMALLAVGSQEFVRAALPPFLILTAVTLIPAAVVWYRVRKEPGGVLEHRNPTQIRVAVLFGAMYVLVLLALAAAKSFFGHYGGQAMYVVAAISGLTDLDAITLSTARMSATVDPQIAADGWRLILVAAIANFASKAALAGILGNRRLLARVAMLFSFPVVGGILLLWLCP
jgi:uncharacterized membrane protein (DUF4010 family)